ncbi:MAG: hypothetical protein JJ863_19925 [Deltaproteobacteria bacterium]|nr:hypothetical protein [Deltaproteobacteria bacterium]
MRKAVPSPCGRAKALRVVLVMGLLACGSEFDSTRVTRERGTLGEEMYRLFCQRLASSEVPNDVSGRETRALCDGEVGPEAAPTERLRVLAENRDRLVVAFDTTMPEPIEDDLDHFMLQLLPLYDPPTERLPEQTRATAELLNALVEDDEALGALERLSHRGGYRPLRLALGVARPALSYPGIVGLADSTLDAIGPGGTAESEWEDLLDALALDLAIPDEEIEEDGPSTLELTRQLLFTQRDAFGRGPGRLLTLRDRRGVALPFSVDDSVPPPFVDRDGDGLADIDPLGRFVGDDGTPLDVATPFPVAGEITVLRDPNGRALRPDDSPYYRSFDVSRTALAGIARDSADLFDPDQPAALDLAGGMPALLGPVAERTERMGGLDFTYPGFDTSQSPMLDLIDASTALLGRDETDDVLAALEVVVRDHESEVAALVDAGLFGDAVGDATPGAAIPDESELWDDVIQVAIWMAQEPGLLEATLRALADPQSKRLGQIYAEMMRYSDDVGYDMADLNRPMREQVWSREVDPSAPESATNTSLFQESIGLIHDLDGVRLCNKEGARLGITLPVFGYTRLPGSFAECELLEIDNVAETYAQAIVGRASIEIKPAFLRGILDLGGAVGLGADEVLENESGIDGLTTSPTPEAMNRLVFAPRNQFLTDLIDPPQTRDGANVEDRYDGTTFAWERRFRFCGDSLVTPDTPCSDPEAVTFYEAMGPLIAAFDTFDGRTEGRFLFGRLISALYTHWPSPDDPQTQSTDPSGAFFAHDDDGRSYEPVVAALFADCQGPVAGVGSCNPREAGQMIQRLHDLLVVMDDIEVRPGVDGIDALAVATETLVDPARNDGLADRQGRTESTTNGGSRTVGMTPLLALLDALGGIDDAWAANPDRHARHLSGRSQMVDVLLTVEETGGQHQFVKRRVPPVLEILIPFIRERIADHRAAGDLEEWSRGIADRVETSIGSATGAAMLNLVDALREDEAATDELSGLVRYLMDEEAGADAFDNTMIATADLLQLLEDDTNLDPLFQALSTGVSPDARAVADGGGSVDGSALSSEGSALDETLALLRDIVDVDERETLPVVLRNLVSLPPETSGETPLEIIIDVVAEVNRARPGIGGAMLADDHAEVLGTAHDYLTDEYRGLERMWDVVQNRTINDGDDAP